MKYALAVTILIALQGSVVAAPARYVLAGPIVDEEGPYFADWIKRSKAAGATSLEVEIDSGGGDVRAALAMFVALKRAGIPSVCTVRGAAASAAFLVLQACSRRVMLQGARLATHEPFAQVAGAMTRDDARRMAEELDRMATLWNGLIAQRLDMTAEAYREKVANGATWVMDEDGALDANAIDMVAPR